MIIWHRFCSLKSTRYYHSKHSVVIGLLNQGICLIESQLYTFFGHHKIKDNFPNISIRGLFQSEQLKRYIISHLVQDMRINTATYLSFMPMAIMITDECINCGACEPECPNTAIYDRREKLKARGSQDGGRERPCGFPH